MSDTEIWVFGYGSLIWDRSGIKPLEERVDELSGWHKDWTWISKRRCGAPTCSLRPGGKVKGVFLRLNPKTQESDLETLRKRESRSSEEFVENIGGINGKIYFWTMGSNLDKYDDTRELKGIELYRALAKRAKKLTPEPDGKTAEEYAFVVHEFDPDDELTKMYVNEIRRLSESDPKDDPNQVIQTVGNRIEALKANRNFFTALFTVESVVLTILFSYIVSMSSSLWASIPWLLASIIPALLGIFALTDSIHFYSKYIEYKYAWNQKVHGEAYKNTTGEEKSTNDLKRALEADDVGYYCVKLSLLFFLWFLASPVFAIESLNLYLRISIFLISIVFLTLAAVFTYKSTHRKRLPQAFKDFFRRKAVFRDS